MIPNAILLIFQINKFMNHSHLLLFSVSPPSLPLILSLFQVLRSAEPHHFTNTSVSIRLSWKENEEKLITLTGDGMLSWQLLKLTVNIVCSPLSSSIIISQIWISFMPTRYESIQASSLERVLHLIFFTGVPPDNHCILPPLILRCLFPFLHTLFSDIVIPRMKSVFSDIPIKFLVMLRDPVGRAYSQYQMAIDTSGTPEQLKLRGLGSYSGKSFEEIIETEIAVCEEAGLTVWPLKLLLIFEYFLSLIRVMKSFRGICFPPFRCSMADTPLSFVDCTHFNFNPGSRAFLTKLKCFRSTKWRDLNHRFPVLRQSSSFSYSLQIQQTLNDVFEFISLPPSDIEDVNPKNSRSYSEMSPQVPTTLYLTLTVNS